KNGRETSLWHWGDNGSFKCFVVANPARQSAVLLFTNSENGLAIAPAIVRDATGDSSPAFNWIKYDAYDSAAMKFRKAVRENGVAAAVQAFASSLKDGTVSEGSVNSVAYHLLWQKQRVDAIQLFKLNSELHPQSANTFDSLGEAYMESGDKALAVQNYEKSLSLDPKNSNAAARLKKLTENER
ncbi:MAG TPA: tetratricopeptide repeat protein, partial [Candidatus Acidoferrum sp.]|nr:tetratricopeptide repeat protein [Candidatus Acidoferrum sp.]